MVQFEEDDEDVSRKKKDETKKRKKKKKVYVYDPPKWKTLDIIDPGRDSVPEFADEVMVESRIESLIDSLTESRIESRIESRAGTTVRPELVVRMLHRRFCAAALIPACCCISGPIGGSGTREVV